MASKNAAEIMKAKELGTLNRKLDLLLKSAGITDVDPEASKAEDERVDKAAAEAAYKPDDDTGEAVHQMEVETGDSARPRTRDDAKKAAEHRGRKE